MKFNALAVSGLAFSTFLVGVPALAQDNRVDANGMPTTHSTPAEHAATAGLNDQAAAASANDQTVAQAQQGDAQYQAQQQQYQNQLQQNQAAQQDYQNKSAQYQDQTIAYDQLRTRYAAERAAYHRGAWGRYARWTLDDSEANAGLVGQRVEILNGDHVGTVESVAHSPNGHVEALRVRLDNDHMVWIDQADIRYDRGDSIVMTNLDRADLRQMANESL
jgi:hypothetical protein